MDTTHEDLCIIILLNYSLNEDGSCAGNKNIHFILNYYFPRIVPIYEMVWVNKVDPDRP